MIETSQSRSRSGRNMKTKAQEILEELNESEEEYQKWKKESDELNAVSDKTSAALRKIAGDNKGGTVPADVKSSAEFKAAKRAFDVAFQALRNFNQKSPKEFQKRSAAERRANRESK